MKSFLLANKYYLATFLSLLAVSIGLAVINADQTQTQKNVTIRTKVLKTKQECIDAFGPRGKNLLKSGRKKPIYPVKVTIENKSSSTWNVSTNIKTAHFNEILERLRPKKDWKALLAGVGILAASLAAGGVLGGLLGFAVALPAASGCPCCVLIPIIFFTSSGCFVGTATGSAILITKRVRNNRTARKNLISHTHTTAKQNDIAINPQKGLSFYLFVHQRDYQNSISITLCNNNKNLVFNLDLPEIRPC